MTETSIRSKKLLKYVFRLVVGLLLLLLIGFGIIWYYASSNQEIIREKVAQLLEKELGTAVAFSHYSISNTDHFPFLAVQLKDLSLKGADYEQYQRELLHIGQLAFLFHPFDILREKYTIRQIQVEQLKAQIYTDTLGNKNTRLLQFNTPNPSEETQKAIFDIDEISFKDCSFDLTNDQLKKSYRFQLPAADLRLFLKETMPRFRLKAACLFEGLLFNAEKGPFLADQLLELESDIELDRDAGLLRFLPTPVAFNDQEIQLEGYLALQDTNHLHLELKTDGLLLEDARPLLNPGINTILEEIQIDQPIEAHMVLDGPTVPGYPIPVKLDFSTEKARLKFQQHRLEDIRLKGHFENDCQVKDRIGPETGCLDIIHLSGMYGGTIPFDLSGRIQNLEDAEYLKIKAKANPAIIHLQQLFEKAPELDFRKGQAKLHFNFEGNPISFLNNQKERNDHQLNGSLRLIDTHIGIQEAYNLKEMEGAIRFDQRHIHLEDLGVKVNGLPVQITGQLTEALQKFIGNPVRLGADLDVFTPKVDFAEIMAALGPEPARDTSNTLPLSVQLEDWTTQLNQLLDLKIGVHSDTITYQEMTVSDLDFHLEVTGDCHKGDLLGEQSCLRISRLKAKVLDGVPVNAAFSLNQLNNPMLEVQLEGDVPLQKIQQYFPVKEIDVKEGNAQLRLRAAAPLDDYSSWDRLSKQLQFDGELSLQNIAGEHRSSQQKVQQLKGRIRFNRKQLAIENLQFDYADLSPNLSGRIDDYLSLLLNEEELPTAKLALQLPLLDLSSPQTETIEEITLIPSELLALAGSAFDYVKGKLAISVGELRIPDYQMNDLSFELGLLTRLENNCTIRSLILDQFQTLLWGNTSLKGKIEIVDLDRPELFSTLKVQIPIEEMGRLVTSRWLRFKDGWADLDLTYRTQIRDTIDAINYLLNADLDGSVTFTSAEIDYTAREFMFNNINGTIDFNDEVLSTYGTSFVLNRNPVSIRGSCFDYLDFFILPDRKIQFDLELEAPVFDFDYFQTPEELGLSVDTNQVESSTDKFEKLLNSGTIELSTKIQQLIYRRFQPQEVEGEIQLSANRVGLKNVKMSLAEGTFAIDGDISEIAQHTPKANVKAKFMENSISKVFFNFDNFGQQDMTHENIDGFFSADIQFQSGLNADYKVVPETISGEMDLMIYNGALIELPAFSELSGILFKKRQMNNIAFDTLQTTTHLSGSDLLVDYFYVHSTSLDFGVEGRYSFGQGDRTYMLFEVPTGNIFRRYVPKEELSNRKKRRRGFPLLIEAKEKKDKLRFRVRLFKKRRKLREVLKR